MALSYSRQERGQRGGGEHASVYTEAWKRDWVRLAVASEIEKVLPGHPTPMDDDDDDDEGTYKGELEISTVYQDLESLTHYQSLPCGDIHTRSYTRVYSDILPFDGPLNYFVRSVTPYEGVKKM